MALGGAQRLLLDQATWFHSRGHRVLAAFIYDKEGLQQSWSKQLGFQLLTLSSVGPSAGALGKTVGLIGGLVRLWSLLRRERPDVMVTFTYDSNILALPVAWLTGTPARIATHHGIIEGFPRLAERFHAALVNAGVASVLVNVSRKVLEQAALAGIRRERMTVIPNGIPPGEPADSDRFDVRRELGIGTGQLLLLSVGRLVYQKGHEYLIQAVRAIVDQFPIVQVAICGEGPLHEQLQSQIERLSLGDHIHLLGNRMDVGRLLAGADGFVLPSRWEGLPVALLEAMERGLPVIATRVEGVEEVIQGRHQGLLVPPEDARALAAALKEMLSSEKLRREMGEGARARVREAYTVDIMCEKYLSLMQRLLAQRLPGHRLPSERVK